SDVAGAREIAANDPYAKAGLFASVDIRPWNWAIKNPDSK
ncbi:YciI family protein, partial [Escherichia coli]